MGLQRVRNKHKGAHIVTQCMTPFTHIPLWQNNRHEELISCFPGTEIHVCVGGVAKVTARGSSFGVIEQFCILTVLVGYTNLYMDLTAQSYTHTTHNQMHKNCWKQSKVSSRVQYWTRRVNCLTEVQFRKMILLRKLEGGLYYFCKHPWVYNYFKIKSF